MFIWIWLTQWMNKWIKIKWSADFVSALRFFEFNYFIDDIESVIMFQLNCSIRSERLRIENKLMFEPKT